MQYGRFAVDYEYRPYNPERMRNERVARAQAALKKHGLGAVILFDYDYHRYLGYYSFHQYCRRRLGHFVLLIAEQGEIVSKERNGRLIQRVSEAAR
jgi:hypothetical protein